MLFKDTELNILLLKNSKNNQSKAFHKHINIIFTKLAIEDYCCQGNFFITTFYLYIL